MNDNDKPQMDFSSLDQIMMMMVYGASNIVDKQWSTERQANAIASYYARFLEIRATHEESHTTKQEVRCPFCMSLKLSLALNREAGAS